MGAELFNTERQTDEQGDGESWSLREISTNMTKLTTVFFCNFANALKTGKIIEILLNTGICLSADFVLCSKLKQKYGWSFRFQKGHNSRIFNLTL